MSHLGNQLKVWREARGITVEALVEMSGLSIEKIAGIEKLASIQDKSDGVIITITNICKLCWALGIDDISIFDNVIEVQRPPEFFLEELEPGGPGTNEQRAIRLACHDQISFGRAAEILRVRIMELPKLESTGCSCPGCRKYVEHGYI